MKTKWIADAIGVVLIAIAFVGVFIIVYSLADRLWYWTAPR